MPDPLSQFRERDGESYMDLRQSTPYTTHGGEKTDPFDPVTINRARSQKETSRRDPAAASESFAAHKSRSSSVPKSSTKGHPAPGLNVPVDDDLRPHTADETTAGYANGSFKDRASAKYNSGNAANTAHTRDGSVTDARKGSSAHACK